MPRPIIAYLKGIFYNADTMTATMLASVIGDGSHDRYTRLLTRAKSVSQTLLTEIAGKVFGALRGGDLILDDTVIAKPFAKLIAYIAWVWSSKEERSVLGINVVVLCWSNGTITIPIGFRIWHKSTGGSNQKPRSKVDLALDLLKLAKRLNIAPDTVLFDSYYAADRILRWIDAQGWTYVTKLKRNRKLLGKQIRHLHRNPYWRERGVILTGCDVTVVRHGKRYFATNDHNLTTEEIRDAYRRRWVIEEVFKFLHSKLGMDDCQSRSPAAQEHHITLCMLAHILIERERTARNWTRYRLKHELSLRRERYEFFALQPVFSSA